MKCYKSAHVHLVFHTGRGTIGLRNQGVKTLKWYPQATARSVFYLSFVLHIYLCVNSLMVLHTHTQAQLCTSTPI